MTKPVADELLGKLAIKQAELFRRVKEGSNDPHKTIGGLQKLIEQQPFVVDQKTIELSVDNVDAEWNELVGILQHHEVTVTKQAIALIGRASQPVFLLRSPEVVSLKSIPANNSKFSSVLLGYCDADRPRQKLTDLEISINVALKAVAKMVIDKVCLFEQGIGALICIHSVYAQEFLVFGECCGAHTLTTTQQLVPGALYHCLVKANSTI